MYHRPSPGTAVLGATATATGGLAATGFDSVIYGAVAIALIVVGLVLLRVSVLARR
jgi:hypothetical protein